KVWLKREQIRMDGSLKAYMFKIGQNMIVDYYRNQNRQRRMASVQLLFLESDSQKEESKLEKEERIIQMRKVINKLHPKRKKVFELCKFEEKSYEEVSMLLNISLSTISDHIVKAKSFIKTELKIGRAHV